MPSLDTTWRKSTYSLNNGSCVEARQVDSTVELRDTKDREGPVLRIGAKAWSAFVAGVRHGEFDLP